MAAGGVTPSTNEMPKRPECTICLEFLDTGKHIPLSLQCRHTVCRSCVHRLYKGQGHGVTTVTCPICRDLTNVPGGDISKIPRCYGLMDILDPMCGNCSMRFTDTCPSCKGKVCSKCLQLHKDGHKLHGILHTFPFDPVKASDVEFDQKEADAKAMFDGYARAVTQARDRLLEELRQARQDNNKNIIEWQDRHKDKLGPLSKTTDQLKKKLNNITTPKFTSETLANLKTDGKKLKEKYDSSKVGKPITAHYTITVNNKDLPSAIAGCVELQLTPSGPVADYGKAREKQEIGGPGTDPGKFGNPFDVSQISSGHFIVSDMHNHRYQILDSKLQPVSVGSQITPDKQFREPAGVAKDSTGLVYVTDTTSNNIQIFNQDGSHLRSIGSRGSDPGQFKAPHGISIDSKGNIYVCDRDNKRVQVITPKGQYIRTLVQTGEGAAQLRSLPSRVSVTVDDKVVVTDYLKDGVGGNVYIYDRSGHHVKTLVKGPNTFACAEGTASDKFRNLLVADYKGHCIVVFNKNLKRLGKIGTPGNGPGQLWGPAGITLTKEGDMVVCDWDNHKILLYEIPTTV